MTSIAAAGNVEVPAYLVLIEKGFEVEWRGDQSWTASKGDTKFEGEGPIELLGVVCMYENRGESWQASDKDIDDFLQKFPQE